MVVDRFSTMVLVTLCNILRNAPALDLGAGHHCINPHTKENIDGEPFGYL